MKLIDCEELMETLAIDMETCPGCPEPEWLQELSDIFDTMEEDVLHCEDCKYYSEVRVKRNGEVIEEAYFCKRWGNVGAEAKGYCAWGMPVRREA